MGTFTHSITLSSPVGDRTETVNCLMDTEAMFTVIPALVLERLDVTLLCTLPVQFANGQVERWQTGEVDTELENEEIPILCLFGSENVLPPIVAHTLETFPLTVDPAEQELVPKEALLM